MTAPATPGRRGAWLEIDLGAIRHNVATLRTLADGAALAMVVKAEAYGHGMDAVVESVADRVDALCVATLDEAIRLRDRVPGRILLLYPVPWDVAAEAVQARVELTVMSPEDLEALRGVAAAARDPVAIHLCVETGLGRGGLSLADLLRMAEVATADGRFRVAGLWTHLASPDDPEMAGRQVARFEDVAATLTRRGIPVPPRHVAASGGLLAGTAPPYDMVRLGLALYGVVDAGLPVAPGARQAAEALRPAMSLKARPAAISEVDEGEGVGYGSRWRAGRPSRVAILPVGYGDGYLRGTQPGAVALVRGRRVPLAGVISMDALAVDVTDVPGVGVDDEFVLLGRQGDEVISAGELARARNTIAWEVLSAMAPRLARVYHR